MKRKPFKKIKKKIIESLKRRKKRKIVRKRPKRSRPEVRKRKRKKRAKEKTKRLSRPVFIKPEENPIISPNPECDWEAWQTFNPGVLALANKVHFLYRAIGKDGLSRFGYAASDDGFSINERLSHPVYEHGVTKPGLSYYSFVSGGSFGGVEDPRLVRVDQEDILYITYTACDHGLGVALTSIKIEDFLNKKWRWEAPVLISPPGEVHKNWVIFPEKINGQYAILHSLNPRVSIAYRSSLKFKQGEYIASFYDGRSQKDGWERQIKGVGPPPIKTQYGWLVFYHGIDKLEPGKYKVGAMLLDLVHPETILTRFPEPILSSEETYETHGFKPGIVYASGAIVKRGEILIYYGAADSYVGLAYADFEEFMRRLIERGKPKLKRKLLKIKR